MLDLAFKHREALQQKYLKVALNSDRYKYSVATNWLSYELKLDDNNWNKLEFVSINSQNEIIGFLKCDINRAVHYAHNLRIINFEEKPNFLFSKDLKEFIIDILFLKFRFNKLQFTCVVGNPIEKTYDRLIAKYGGRIVGIYEKDVRLIDNKIYDLKLYEITREVVLSKLSKRR